MNCRHAFCNLQATRHCTLCNHHFCSGHMLNMNGRHMCVDCYSTYTWYHKPKRFEKQYRRLSGWLRDLMQF